MSEKLVKEIQCPGRWAVTAPIQSQMVKRKYVILVTFQCVLEAVVTFQWQIAKTKHCQTSTCDCNVEHGMNVPIATREIKKGRAYYLPAEELGMLFANEDIWVS